VVFWPQWRLNDGPPPLVGGSPSTVLRDLTRIRAGARSPWRDLPVAVLPSGGALARVLLELLCGVSSLCACAGPWVCGLAVSLLTAGLRCLGHPLR
jgi:hypothetical protein